MTFDAIERAIYTNGKFLRDLKTRSNALRQKYSTREQRETFLDSLVPRTLRALQRTCEWTVQTIGFDPFDIIWLGPIDRRVTDEEWNHAFWAVVYVQTAHRHLTGFHCAIKLAEMDDDAIHKANCVWWLATKPEKAKHDPIEAGFEAWIKGRSFAPIFTAGQLLSDPDVPEEIRRRANTLVSGAVLSETSLAHAPSHQKNVQGLGYNDIKLLPNTVMEHWTDDYDPKYPNIFKTIHDLLEEKDVTREVSIPKDKETGGMIDLFSREFDPLAVLEANIDASAEAERVNAFLDSLIGHQRRFAELAVTDPDFPNRPDKEIAQLLDLKPPDIPPCAIV